MFVDPRMLRTGGNDSRRAAEHAQEGVDALSRGLLSSGMFGEFAGAEAFHQAASSARTKHVAHLQAHQQALTDVGSKTHRAAMQCTDMDAHNAAEMHSARGKSA